MHFGFARFYKNIFTWNLRHVFDRFKQTKEQKQLQELPKSKK